jgi:transcriptional regulator with XRE-family HTH domain
MMTNDSNLAKRLKNAREYLHLSQEYVAKQIGMHRTSLVAIEAGTRKVSSEELRRFSEIYGWTADELLFGKEEPKAEKLQIFARSFEELTDQDQQEILNLIEFKRLMKEQRRRNAEQS